MLSRLSDESRRLMIWVSIDGEMVVSVGFLLEGSDSTIYVNHKILHGKK